MSAFEASRAAVSDLRHSVFHHRAQRLADDIATLRVAAGQTKDAFFTEQIEEVKWRHVPLANLALKFAVSLCNTEALEMALTKS